MVLLIVWRTLIEGGSPAISLPQDVVAKDYQLFEPTGIAEFQSGPLQETVIPRIIHQTWRDTLIPPKFVNNIRSFVKNNPGWQYYLWTDDNSRLLLVKHYQELLPLWDDLVATGNKQRLFNIIRFVAMYVYGGVYVDLDTVNYRPLEGAINKHNCILPTEPFEHALLNNADYLMTNAILICRAKHPFFKYILDNIHHYMHLSSHWDAAGPGFLTSLFKMYIKTHVTSQNSSNTKPDVSQQINQSPYFFKSDIPSVHPDSVFVPTSQYFTSGSDVLKNKQLVEKCRNFHQLHFLHQRVCAHLSINGMIRHSPFAFIDHFWQNNWYSVPQQYMYLYVVRWLFGTDIRTIVPNCQVLGS